MPRQLRYRLPGVPQHVVQRGNNRQATFFDEGDYRRYLEDLQEATEKYECDVHAYVLMTNHVHLLMTPHKEDSIAKVMQSIGRKYVRYINGTHKRTGTLWEGRYKASIVQNETYLLRCYFYIELNPVRARMVKSPVEYEWSSYGCNAHNKFEELVTAHDQYLALGKTDEERTHAYRELLRQRLDSDMLQEIRESTNQCRVLGTERFRKEIEQVLKIKTTPERRGRKRKETDLILALGSDLN